MEWLSIYFDIIKILGFCDLFERTSSVVIRLDVFKFDDGNIASKLKFSYLTFVVTAAADAANQSPSARAMVEGWNLRGIAKLLHGANVLTSAGLSRRLKEGISAKCI